MRYCVWFSELPDDPNLAPEITSKARLYSAGLPVTPGWVVLPNALALTFQAPKLQTAIQKEVSLVRNYPDAVTVATDALRQQIINLPLPGDVTNELGKMFLDLRHHLLSADQPIRLRLKMEGRAIERPIKDLSALELALKQLYALQISERHFLDKKEIHATGASIQYIGTDEVYGNAHIRDDLHEDESIVQITVQSQPSQVFRLVRKDGRILTGPSQEDPNMLTVDQAKGLTRLINRAQEEFNEPHEFAWTVAHGRFWLEGGQPLGTKAPIDPLSFHSGSVRGVLRKINSPEDRTRLKPGDIAVVDSVLSTDYTWLAPAAGLVTAYGSHYGTPATLGRRLGIPVTSGLTPAELDQLQTGQLVTLNGHNGTISLGDGLLGGLPKITKVIITSDDVQPAQLPTADGLLYTSTTGLLTLHALHPHEILRRERSTEYVELLADELLALAKDIYPKPLFYRFHDGQKQGGPRSLRNALQQPTWLEVELRMLDRAMRHGAKNVMPLTPLLHELSEVADLRLRAANYPELLRRLWITCGTPALAIQAEELGGSTVAGISLDMAYLARLTLGFSGAGVEHPAVLQQAEYLLRAAKEAGIATMVDTSGRLPSKSLIAQLVTAGADYLAVNHHALQMAEQVVMETEKALYQEYLLAGAHPIC